METLLQTRGLTLSFGGVVAAAGIDFELKSGERLAVIGANGAGKTTFINMVTGYIKPTSGVVTFAGTDITKMHPRQIVHQGIGRSFQLDPENTPPVGRLGLHPDFSAHPFHRSADYRQPDARALILPWSMKALKNPEDPLLIFLRNPDAVVFEV